MSVGVQPGRQVFGFTRFILDSCAAWVPCSNWRSRMSSIWMRRELNPEFVVDSRIDTDVDITLRRLM